MPAVSLLLLSCRKIFERDSKVTCSKFHCLDFSVLALFGFIVMLCVVFLFPITSPCCYCKSVFTHGGFHVQQPGKDFWRFLGALLNRYYNWFLMLLNSCRRAPIFTVSLPETFLKTSQMTSGTSSPTYQTTNVVNLISFWV